MGLSTPVKVGVASGIAVVALIVGAGVLAWNRAKPPAPQVEAESESPAEPDTATAPTSASRPPNTPLFTLSPTTTVITAPLHEDGTPDYIAATNALLSKGVSQEENVVAAWLPVVGRPLLAKSTADELLAMACTTTSDAQWIGFYKYCDDQGHPERGSAAKVDDLQLAEAGPWRDEDLPVLAAYLHEQAAELDAGEKAWSRPKYWLPSIANDHRSMTNVLLPALGPARELANALLARSMQRLAVHDLDGCCADVRCAGHIAALISTGQSIIERLVAYAIQNGISRTLAGAAATGKLTAAECTALVRVSGELPPTQDLTQTIDTIERWDQLDTVLRIATGHASEMADSMDKSSARIMVAIEPESVDWDTVLHRFNASADKLLTVVKIPLLEEMQDAQKKLIASGAGGLSRGSLRNLTPLENESRKAYTHRVGAALEQAVSPDVSRAEELRRAAAMQVAMARAMLGLATYHAAEGHWPTAADVFGPAHLPELPIDIYVPGGATRVLYVLNAAGPTVYSVGRNHQDDHGVRDSQGHDDLSIGVAIAGPG